MGSFVFLSCLLFILWAKYDGKWRKHVFLTFPIFDLEISINIRIEIYRSPNLANNIWIECNSTHSAQISFKSSRSISLWGAQVLDHPVVLDCPRIMGMILYRPQSEFWAWFPWVPRHIPTNQYRVVPPPREGEELITRSKMCWGELSGVCDSGCDLWFCLCGCA